MSFRFVLIATTVLAAWSASAAAEAIKIGVTPGPHAQILEAVKPIAAKKGLYIQLIEFSDCVVPNAALDAGELQANSFQNQPYLDNQKADRGYKIESVGLTVNFPIGVYSKKHKSWSDIPNGGTVSIFGRRPPCKPHRCDRPASETLNIKRFMHRSKLQSYSITSSARASSAGGIVSPSALAVLRLTNSTILDGNSTGRSPGAVPRRILSTK
jgi:hypothetical protein